MKKFLQDLETELRKNNLSDEEISEIIADHEEMIETAMNEGLTDAELEKKFGNPKEVAEELSQFSEKKEKGRENKKMKRQEFTGIEEGYHINIGLINEDIEFQTNEDGKIIIEYSGKRDLEDYTIEFNNNELVLKTPKKREIGSFFGHEKNQFTISLPQGLKIGNFILKEINGDIELAKHESESLQLDTKNGDLKLSEFKTNTLKLNTINGDVNMEDILCKTISVSQISGDLKMKKVTAIGDFDAHSVSGDMNFENVNCDEFIMKTVSGDVNAYEFYPTSVSLNSVSGDITITNTDMSKTIDVKHERSVSGDIKIRIKK